MFESLELSKLPEKNRGILRHPTNTRPSIWAVEEDGVRAVVKDFSTCGFLYRNTIGRFLIWRESKAYMMLDGLRGVPKFHGVIDGLALVVEDVGGKNFVELERSAYRFTEAMFRELEGLVEGFHRRGVVHCDLKRTPNIILGGDGKIYVVDWAAFMSKREFRFFPLNLVYRRFLLDDRLAITKLKVNNLPEAVTPEERERYEKRSAVERSVRAVRDRLRSLLKRLA